MFIRAWFVHDHLYKCFPLFLQYKFYIVSDVPNISLDLPVTLKYPITEGKRNTNSDITQCMILYPETNLTSDTVGEDGCFLSYFIKRQGDNPSLKTISLANCVMPLSKWVELFRFTSTCKYLTHLYLSSSNVGEAAYYLAQSITSWGDNPPLEYLNFSHYSIPEQVWPDLLQSLSSCKQLTNLNLSSNIIGEAGRNLAQSITSWGDNPPLKSLVLESCSIPEQVWPELLHSLSSCKQLTDLNLLDNTIGEAGRYLKQAITSWGDNPPLKSLILESCSIPEQVWPGVLQSLSSCKWLCYLNLLDNTIGEAGCYLAQAITSWGDNPPLKALILESCSIPEQVWPGVLQSLSSCQQLTDLNLLDNTIGEAGRYLAQSITSWGENPPLEALNLENCSIPEQMCLELLQSLSCCNVLSILDLSGNTIGEAGHYLSQSITSWGDSPPLENLFLSHCSIPEHVWPELLQSLSSCKQLTGLDLSGDTIGEAGHYLAQLITSWGNNPSLEKLYLSDCSIPEQVWPELLHSLSFCERLRYLNVTRNCLTGCFFCFLPDPKSRLTLLKFLGLEHTTINKTDIQHLTQLIRDNKLPHLKYLYLEEKSWNSVEEELQQLKKTLLAHCNGESILHITSCNSEAEEIKLQASLQENRQVQKTK